MAHLHTQANFRQCRPLQAKVETSQHHFVAGNKSPRGTERYATVTTNTFTAANLYRATKVICVVYDALTLPSVLYFFVVLSVTKEHGVRDSLC